MLWGMNIFVVRISIESRKCTYLDGEEAQCFNREILLFRGFQLLGLEIQLLEYEHFRSWRQGCIMIFVHVYCIECIRYGW